MFGCMGETFKDYVIEQFDLDRLSPMPGEEEYESDSPEAIGDEHKNRVLARRFEPDDVDTICQLSRAFGRKDMQESAHVKFLKREFLLVFARPFAYELLLPFFDYIENHEGDMPVNSLVMAARGVILKHNPGLKLTEHVSESTIGIIKEELVQQAQARKAKAAKEAMQTEIELKKRFALPVQQVLPKRRRQSEQANERAVKRVSKIKRNMRIPLPVSELSGIDYAKTLQHPWLWKYEPASPDEASEPPQKKARVAVDLTCTERMV